MIEYNAWLMNHTMQCIDYMERRMDNIFHRDERSKFLKFPNKQMWQCSRY